MRTLLVATRSTHKLAEIRRILEPRVGVILLDLDAARIPPDPREDEIESFDTFAENARAKARHFAALAGGLVLADDSGLCVDALGGAPGVRSKRFSGRSDLGGYALDQANNAKLLDSLRGVPPLGRSAHYLCAAALFGPDLDLVFTGRCDGVILSEPRGTGGFGYDPLFFIPEENATFGELPPERKNELSHRAGAMRQVAAALLDLSSDP